MTRNASVASMTTLGTKLDALVSKKPKVVPPSVDVKVAVIHMGLKISPFKINLKSIEDERKLI